MQSRTELFGAIPLEKDNIMHESTRRFLGSQIAMLRAQALGLRHEAEFEKQAMESHLADALRKEERAEDYQKFLNADEAQS